ncbi:MAG TPA: RNA polymerase sigma-70 factor [Gemmatimonadaceae bacterium]|nr:RNA polymerase sigma-70 factor [Gemmatimonadaceae bacterium]
MEPSLIVMDTEHPTPPTSADDVVERYRPRLFGIAYRMLSDVQEAEDLVQETFLRWHQAKHDDLVSEEGWLVAVITRLAIDRLRRAERERLRYVGNWLPEPIATASVSPDQRAELASDLSMAFLVLLERLAPEERAAFLLREVFDAGYDEIARILDKAEPAVRQVVHRAKTRVREGRRRFSPPAERHAELLQRFLDALAADDKDAMLGLFAPDATFTGDGGGKVGSVRRVVEGPDRITRLFLGLEHKYPGVVTHEIIELNGQPAIGSYHDGVITYVTLFETDGDHILAVYRVLNPDKLAHLR